MPITEKLKTAVAKTKSFVSEHKQTIVNTVMLVGLTGVSAAVVVLTRETKELGKDDQFLWNRYLYSRDRIYGIERHTDMPVHKDDQRHHDWLESEKAKTPITE